MNGDAAPIIANGVGQSDGQAHPFRVESAQRYSLRVAFEVAPATDTLTQVELQHEAARLELGSCRFVADEPGCPRGYLHSIDDVHDFARLARLGKIRGVDQDFKLLPLILSQKADIRPEFRDYTAGLVYELQVLRKIFDDIDRGLDEEPPAVAESVRARLVDERAPEFNAFFDQRLRQLEQLTAEYTRQEHERHGFYFRRQVWDLILRSAFLARTNLRPRGYAGDSAMMRWLYQRDYVGAWMFDRLMHRHPVETAAAQAVRNRRGFIPARLGLARDDARARGRTDRIRFMSVACGPAWELADLFADGRNADEYAGLLLDQDEEALGEAEAALDAARARLGKPIDVVFDQDSVRTMLRTRDLTARWGEFDYVYSMGLFDYLNTPVATAVLHKLYSLLRPGGHLTIGNYHVDNPSRIYMDYWMDWALLYRTEQDMLDLTAGLPGASAEIVFEDTRSQMFLCVRKDA